MKKIMLIALVSSLTCATTFSQEDEFENNPVLDRKHELRIDAIEGLTIPMLEINYEYVLSKYSGVGAAISINFNNDNNVYYGQKFAFTPFYRQYFLNKKEYGARGLFVEGMMQLAAGEDTSYFYEYDAANDIGFERTESNDWFDAGIGIAVGQKWVSNNGFVFELSIGGGRYLSRGDDQPDAFLRGGVLVGYRF